MQSRDPFGKVHLTFFNPPIYLFSDDKITKLSNTDVHSLLNACDSLIFLLNYKNGQTKRQLILLDGCQSYVYLESISSSNSLCPELFSIVSYFLLLMTFNIYFFNFVREFLCCKIKLSGSVAIGSIRIFRQKADLNFWTELWDFLFI